MKTKITKYKLCQILHGIENEGFDYYFTEYCGKSTKFGDKTFNDLVKMYSTSKELLENHINDLAAHYGVDPDDGCCQGDFDE
jgi:hypothetical protein